MRIPTDCIRQLILWTTKPPHARARRHSQGATCLLSVNVFSEGCENPPSLTVNEHWKASLSNPLRHQHSSFHFSASERQSLSLRLSQTLPRIVTKHLQGSLGQSQTSIVSVVLFSSSVFFEITKAISNFSLVYYLQIHRPVTSFMDGERTDLSTLTPPEGMLLH